MEEQQGYEQNEYPDYDEEDIQEPEEDVETKVELQFYEAEDLIRKDRIPQAVNKLEELYTLSQENNLRSWKPKILNHLLDLSCRKKDGQKVEQSLEKILKLHESDKLTDTAVKSIISTIKSLDQDIYAQKSAYIMNFFSKLDPPNTLKGFLFMLQKSLADKNKEKSIELLKKTEAAASKIDSIAPDELLSFYSLEVKLSQAAQMDISQKLKKMELKLPYLQNQAYMNDGSLSIIKEALAEIHYKTENYKACAQYLCEAFQEYVRYGKNSGLKQLLKKNAYVSVLCQDPQVMTSPKYNPIYQESSSPFKSDNDIFAIHSFIEAFQQINVKQLQTAMGNIGLQKEPGYEDIEERIIGKLKQQKLVSILKAYQKVKFEYLQKRLGENKGTLEKMVFELIVSQQIRGKIYLREGYVQILPPENEFLTTQLANIQELSLRY